MRTRQYISIGVAILVTAGICDRQLARLAKAADVQHAKQSELIELLQSDAPPQEKAISCKRLAVVGTAAAVPALGALLPDERLSSWARIALEVIPGPEADGVLRAAAGSLDGRLLIGVINSIGVRRDQESVDTLASRLDDADGDVAMAAAVALGRVGSPAAAATLEKALSAGPAAIRSAVAEGCVLVAERFFEQGDVARAIEIYDQVRLAEVPKQRVLEATRGAILARKSAGIPLLVEQLNSSDKVFFHLGLMTAAEMPGSDVTGALVAQLGRSTSQRQVLIVLGLADRSDTTALPALVESAKSGSREVRISAVQVLQHLGDVSSLPTLLEIAVAADADLASAALQALEGIQGLDVDADLAGRLNQAAGETRRVLIELAGRRRIIEANTMLLAATNDSSARIRAAALKSLGSTIEPQHLSKLIDQVVKPAHPEDAEPAIGALQEASVRMPDREACASQLSDAISQGSVATKCKIVEILGTVGGTSALEAVADAAKDKSPQLQDTASRVLGKWMTADAAPVLLNLASESLRGKYQIRALRGFLRIARQFNLPNEQRAQMCRSALQIARRDAEKKLVLEIVERYPSVEMLAVATEVAKTPTLKDDAATKSLIVAQKIGQQTDKVRSLLARVGYQQVKIEIIKAQYGAEGRFADVTDLLRKHVSDLPLIVLPAANYNDSFGGDPAPGSTKQLQIEYSIDEKLGKVSLAENKVVLLPIPSGE